MASSQDQGVILFEIARKLAGDSAKQYLSVYEQAIAKFNPKAQKRLKVCSLNSAGELQGSNTFARALLGRNPQIGIRLGNLYDLLTISNRNSNYLFGTYEDDNAVVLRSLQDPANSSNDYLARTLAKKLGIKEFSAPFVITNLDVEDDERSGYGLVLVPTSSTKVIEAPGLAGSNNERRFTLYDSNGMPIFNDATDKIGKRIVWTRDKGLSGLCLGGDLNLVSGYGNLADSSGGGRTVELSNGAADGDFEIQLTQMYEAQQSELLQRFEAAKRVLRGEK